jgi:hypothetical protein
MISFKVFLNLWIGLFKYFKKLIIVEVNCTLQHTIHFTNLYWMLILSKNSKRNDKLLKGIRKRNRFLNQCPHRDGSNIPFECQSFRKKTQRKKTKFSWEKWNTHYTFFISFWIRYMIPNKPKRRSPFPHCFYGTFSSVLVVRIEAPKINQYSKSFSLLWLRIIYQMSNEEKKREPYNESLITSQFA